MTKIKKTYASQDLTIEQWLELMKTKPKGILFEDYMFPTEKIKDYFISHIHNYEENVIHLVLRSFLNIPSILQSDHYALLSISKFIGSDPEKEKEAMNIPYYRRLVGSLKSGGKIPVHNNISWLIDLLPNNPKDALNVLSAYITLDIANLPDGRIHGLSDAEAIIKARYLNILHDTSILYSLTPIDFEHLIEALYFEMGYITSMTKLSYDRGRDIIAILDTPGRKEKNFIQCKRVSDNVGDSVVSKLLGDINRDGDRATKGTLVTTTEFTAAAIKIGKGNSNIDLIDQKSLQLLLNEHFGASWPLHIDYYINDSKRRHPREKRV